jgi:hypothetical protein
MSVLSVRGIHGDDDNIGIRLALTNVADDNIQSGIVTEIAAAGVV